MTKQFYFFSTILISAFLFFSCSNNADTNEADSEDTVNTEVESEVSDNNDQKAKTEKSVNVKKEKKEKAFYLEDFAQFDDHTQIEEFFGSDNVNKSEIWKAEGTELYLATEVFPNHKHYVTVFWEQNSVGYNDFSFVETTYRQHNRMGEKISVEGDPIKSNTGIMVGNSIEQLRQVNGKSFKFYGLGWDYGGLVLGLKPEFENHSIKLSVPAEYMETEDGWNVISKISGDREFSSDDDLISEVPLQVHLIRYNPGK